MSEYFGQLAALGSSLFFSFSSVSNTLAGRIVGSNLVNRTRLLFAIIWLLFAHLLLSTSLPINAGADRWFWLAASGIIGLALGDTLLFQAFIWIGPRLTMLLMALAPILAAVIAWILLDEILAIGQWTAMAFVLVGVIGVVLDPKVNSSRNPSERAWYLKGILYGLGAAVGQALGLILAKRGLYGDFPAISGALIRMISAAIVLWGIALLKRQILPSLQILASQRKATGNIWIGSLLGPVLGVTLSLFALQKIPVGIASTLSALSPIFLLPISYYFFKEQYGWFSIIGTILAMLGVAVFFLV